MPIGRWEWSGNSVPVTGRLTVMAGYRQMRLNEDLAVRELLATPAPPSPIYFDITDHFHTNNDFHGAELSATYRVDRGRWMVEFLGRLEVLFTEALRRGDAVDAEPADLALFWGALLDGVLTNQVFQTYMADTLRDRLDEIWALFWRGVSGQRPKRTEES